MYKHHKTTKRTLIYQARHNMAKYLAALAVAVKPTKGK